MADPTSPRHIDETVAFDDLLVNRWQRSPWLNSIEPKWVHEKRAVSDPVRTLAVAELMQRICAYSNCTLDDLIVQEGC